MLTGDAKCTKKRNQKGGCVYVTNLFDKRGIPKPFSRAPRLIVYRRSYTICRVHQPGHLVEGAVPEFDRVVSGQTMDHVLTDWQKPDGSFRSRRLLLGWDTIPRSAGRSTVV